MTSANIPPELPHMQNISNVQYARQLNVFDNKHVLQPIKEMLLRHLLKKEVRTNERLNILTDVSVINMQGGHTIYGHNESVVHFAASINKMPVTLLLLEDLRAGHITLSTQLNWAESDQRAGNGIYDVPGAPLTATVEEVMHDMLNRSGNTAVRIIVNKALGGNAAVNQRLADIPEIPNTRLIPVDADRFFLGNTTSGESLFVMKNVLAGNDEYQQYVKELLATNIFVDDGVRSQLAGNDYIVLANKTGLLFDPDGNNFHDVGIIYNTKTNKSYGYSILTTAPSDSAAATDRADQSIKDMGGYILSLAGDKRQKAKHHAQPETMMQQSTPQQGRVLY